MYFLDLRRKKMVVMQNQQWFQERRFVCLKEDIMYWIYEKVVQEMFFFCRNIHTFKDFSYFCFQKVIRRLRERGEPIRLFGESDDEACQRLRWVILLAGLIWIDFKFELQGLQHFRKFKVALNPTYRIFLNFARICVLSCLSKVDNIKKFHRTVFWIISP